MGRTKEERSEHGWLDEGVLADGRDGRQAGSTGRGAPSKCMSMHRYRVRPQQQRRPAQRTGLLRPTTLASATKLSKSAARDLPPPSLLRLGPRCRRSPPSSLSPSRSRRPRTPRRRPRTTTSPTPAALASPSSTSRSNRSRNRVDDSSERRGALLKTARRAERAFPSFLSAHYVNSLARRSTTLSGRSNLGLRIDRKRSPLTTHFFLAYVLSTHLFAGSRQSTKLRLSSSSVLPSALQRSRAHLLATAGLNLADLTARVQRATAPAALGGTFEPLIPLGDGDVDVSSTFSTVPQRQTAD